MHRISHLLFYNLNFNNIFMEIFFYNSTFAQESE